MGLAPVIWLYHGGTNSVGGRKMSLCWLQTTSLAWTLNVSLETQMHSKHHTLTGVFDC